MTILDALRDRRMFGGLAVFRDLTTWRAWLVALAALDGLPLADLAAVGISEAEALACYREHTGRSRWPPPPGPPELIVICGVQSGKSRILALRAAYATIQAAPGTVAALMSQDHRHSLRVLLKYAREAFEELDVFKADVERATADTVELTRARALMAFPCRTESARGFKASFFGGDELAYFRATDGRPVDAEMVRVARGRVAASGGKVMFASSPSGQTGELWRLYQQHYAVDGDPVLVWQASARAMNPLLTEAYAQRMERDDPEGAKSEVHGQFRAGVTTLFDAEALAACVPTGIRERPPEREAENFGHLDSASGSGSAGADDMAAAVARRVGDGAVLVALRRWRPPFNPAATIAEAGDFFRLHGARGVSYDAYAPGFTREALAAAGLDPQRAELDTSRMFLELLSPVNARRVSLLDDPVLLRQLATLERRRGSTGRDVIAHHKGAHDDVAAAAAGALVSALRRSRQPWILHYDRRPAEQRIQTWEEVAADRRAVARGFPQHYAEPDPVIRLLRRQ